MNVKFDGKVIDLDALPEDEKARTPAFKLVKLLSKGSGVSLASAVKQMNNKHPDEQPTTPQNLSNKMRLNTLKLSEFLELCEICEYDISFERRYPTPKNPRKTKRAVSSSEYIKHDDVVRIIESVKNTFEDLMSEGFESIPGINYRFILIAGRKHEEAAEWIKQRIYNGMSPVEEGVILAEVKKIYPVECRIVPHS